jgi:hypothetical protein
LHRAAGWIKPAKEAFGSHVLDFGVGDSLISQVFGCDEIKPSQGSKERWWHELNSGLASIDAEQVLLSTAVGRRGIGEVEEGSSRATAFSNA